MTNSSKIAALCATAALTLSAPLLAQTRVDDDRLDAAQTRFDREVDLYRSEVQRYQSLRADRRDRRQGYQGQSYDPRDDEAYYDPARDYRAGSSYRERVLANDDRVYRGTDGRYYCKRNDGTTGLIVGAAGGGILGNVIDGGRSRTVGTLLGAALGGLAGRSVEQRQSEVRCR